MADQTVIRSNDLIITGNLQVSGSQITTNTDDLTVKDRLITLNKGGTLGVDTAGIEIESGGVIEATIGYTTSGGWDFGSADITTTGTVTGSLSLTANSVNDTHIDFGTGANQVSTADIPEETNLYYTDARVQAISINNLVEDTSPQLGGTLDANGNTIDMGTNTITDTKVGEWDTAYSWGDHSTAGYQTNITAGTTAQYYRGDKTFQTLDTLAVAENTNLYYTTARANTDIDARLATTSIDALTDVDTSGVSSGEVLMWDGSNFVPNAPAVGIANNQISSTTSVTLTNQGTSYSSSGIIATIPSFSINTDGKVQINFTAQVVQETNAEATIGLFRANNGAAMTYTSPVAEYTSMSQGFVSSFVFNDDITGGVSSVEYQVVVKFDTGTTNTYQLSNISFSATEFQIGTLDTLNELTDVTITSQSAGQILKATSATTWVNETPTISINSDVDTTGAVAGNVLRYNGTTWVDTDLTAFNIGEFGDVDTTTASLGKILRYDGSNWSDSDLTPFSIGEFGDVDTTGAVSGKILKYNGTTWVVADDVDTDTGILSVVEDTSPQLGGDLDVQTHSIISTGSNNIVLDPQGTGIVQINGDLTVTGTATTLEVTNVEVEDAIMLLNKHDTQPANNTNDGGIMVQRGTAEDNAAWYWDETDDRWVAATTTNTAGDVDLSATANADIQAGTAYLTATQAQYADLAEIYKSDADYEPGTVVVFGGEHEVTQCNRLLDHRVAGVVSTAPAYLMNKDADGVAVALRGKVPCKVEGPVRKGDLLVTNVTPGTATTLTDDSPAPAGYCVIGKSLEDNNDAGIKLVNIVV